MSLPVSFRTVIPWISTFSGISRNSIRIYQKTKTEIEKKCEKEVLLDEIGLFKVGLN